MGNVLNGPISPSALINSIAIDMFYVTNKQKAENTPTILYYTILYQLRRGHNQNEGNIRSNNYLRRASKLKYKRTKS